jgi:hypothetical protein
VCTHRVQESDLCIINCLPGNDTEESKHVGACDLNSEYLKNLKSSEFFS